MTYRDYLRGDDVAIGVAPTGYRYSTDVNESLPVTPADVAQQVAKAVSLGASVAHLHGRDGDGESAPDRLPAFGAAVREACEDDVLVEYAVGPDCPTGDFLTALDDGQRPDLATVRVGPTQYGYRATSQTSRRDVDRIVEELVDRGVKPNLLVTSGRDLNEVNRLLEDGALESPPALTLLFGATDGTVATPQNALALLDAVPKRAHTFVRATGPNQFPLTTLSVLLGAHPMVGMEDNLFIAPDQPTTSNAQLIRQVAHLASNSLRPIADPDTLREQLGIPAAVPDTSDIEA